MNKKTSPFPYIGGKFYMLNDILNLLDYSKTAYIELFGGSGKVLINKPTHQIEIYNDIDDLLVNIFLQLQKNCDEIIKKLLELPYSEKLWCEFNNDYRIKKFKNDDDIMKAVKYLYLFYTTFAGKKDMSSFSFGFEKRVISEYYNNVINLKLIVNRIKNVIFLCRDYKSILNSILNNNNSDVMIYADPPYFECETHYVVYKKRKMKELLFTKEDHYILADYLNKLNKLNCSIMISYKAHPEIEKLYSRDNWFYIETKETNFCNLNINKVGEERNKKSFRKEWIIMNYKPFQLRLF
ncbi:MAG: hypothetical protein QW474_02980 [Candidatus Aenigmatarchaeota archaeon]